MNTRERMLAGGHVPSANVTIVTASGESLTVQVRGLTQNARGRLLQSSMMTLEDGKTKEVDMVKMQPSLIIETTYDLETGERLFNEADRAELGEMAASYLDPIIEMATKLSGIGKDAVEEAKGN